MARTVRRSSEVSTDSTSASELKLDASTAAAPVATGSSAASADFDNLKASKFKPRPREAWDKDAGYGRYAADEESQVYGILKVGCVLNPVH
jgi:hypothetical protein